MALASHSGSGPQLQSFSFNKLRPARDAEEFDLHRAALEWSLDAPITIQGEQDILSKRNWADFAPYAHQVRNLITFCRRAPVTLLADDVGLGKTISAGLILSELMVRRKVDRVLVVAPKLLLPQWEEELAVKFGIPSSTASGAELKNAFRRQMPAVVTTYHSLRRYLPNLRESSFDMVILDEAHKLRNLHGTSKPPQFAEGIRTALAERVFKYVLMLTATPIQNRLWDLYSLIDLLTVAKGHENPLGPPEAFKSLYIEDSRAVRVRRGKREEFRRHLSNYIVRTRRSDARLVFPTRQVTTYKVGATEPERRLMTIVGDLFNDDTVKLNGLAQSSIGQALMSSPRALLSQALNMEARGTIPSRVVRDLEATCDAIRVSGKCKGLVDLMAELAEQRPKDWRCVVFTSRTQTQEMIGEVLRERDIPVGFVRGGSAHENERSIRKFRESPPGIRALVSTDAGAEGVNLQIANVLVNFDLPWNPMVLEQRIGRVQRLASKHAEVIILNLVLAGSVEEKVVGRLSEKLQAISESLGDIEAILESASMDEGDEGSFETLVRKLVVDSLRGIDVEASTKSALKSIEDAKQIFEAERETVERTLGDLRDLHRAGPRIPEIEPIEPSIEARDFVLRAFGADGGSVRPIDSKILEVTLPGQHPFRLTFDERAIVDAEDTGVFGRTAPRLFVPGKRDFERLSQTWSEKAAALIADRANPSDQALQAALDAVLPPDEPWEVTDFAIDDRAECFHGELWCRATIANDVDRLEKLVRVQIGDAGVAGLPNGNDIISRLPVVAKDLPGELRSAVSAAVIAENDLSKFNTFYAARVEEELPRAGDAEARARLMRQFTPTITAEAVGVRGVRAATLVVNAAVRIDGHGPYGVAFKVEPGPDGVFRAVCEERLLKCEQCGCSLPASATGTCASTGKSVARWLLEPCAASGRLALIDELVVCSESGDRVLPGESDICSETGARVKRSLLLESDMSGKRAVASAIRICEFTGATLLAEELATSELSGKVFRADERVESALTGKAGHESEFVQSVEPAGPVERELARQSSLSGSWAASSALVESEVSPGRWGLPSEVVRCEVSGIAMLHDEAGFSKISGKPAAPSQIVECEFTGALLLPSEAAKSDVSGKVFRADRLVRSVISQRAGYRTEFVESVLPAGLIAKDEAAQSSLSGAWAAASELIESAISPGRRGFPTEIVRCAISGRLMLTDECGRCKVSGEAADPSLMTKCEFTHADVLPRNTAKSDISGNVFRSDRLLRSAISGRIGYRTEFVRSVLSADWIAKDEAAASDVSGDVAASVELESSEREPYRRGLPSELVTCEVSGRRLLRDEVGLSVISGRTVDDSLLVSSSKSGRVALPEEMVVCEQSGERLCPDEVSRCMISGRMVDGRLLALSPVSQRRGLRTLMLMCSETDRLLMPDECIRCAVTGEMVGRDATAVCSITGRVVARSQITNAKTGDAHIAYVDDEVSLDKVEELTGLRTFLSRCGWTGDEVPTIRTGVCAITGLRVAKQFLNERGELADVRDLLDGKSVQSAQPLSAEHLAWLRGKSEDLSTAQEAVGVTTPDLAYAMVCVRCKGGFLSLGTVHAFTVIERSKPPRLLIEPILGKRRADGWHKLPPRK